MSACVINFQGEKCIAATLEALEASDDLIDEIILVDSGSTDRSVDLVSRRFPGVRLIPLPSNRGPAAARNVGCRAARNNLVLFVDHDIILEGRCGGHLLRALEDDPKAVLALPRVLWADRPEVVQFEGADSHFLGLMALRNAGGSASDPVGLPARCGSMVSACFLIHKGRWGGQPLFDERFEFNYEDHDFGIRCRLAGHRILAVASASCSHGDGTIGASVRADEEYPQKRVFCLIRGRWTILFKAYQKRTLLFLCPLLLVFEVAQFLAVLRRGWAREWLRAIGSILTDLKSLMKDRRAIQRSRLIPDRAFLRGGPLPFRPQFPKGRLERKGLSFLEHLSDRYWEVLNRGV